MRLLLGRIDVLVLVNDQVPQAVVYRLEHGAAVFSCRPLRPRSAGRTSGSDSVEHVLIAGRSIPEGSARKHRQRDQLVLDDIDVPARSRRSVAQPGACVQLAQFDPLVLPAEQTGQPVLVRMSKLPNCGHVALQQAKQ